MKRKQRFAILLFLPGLFMALPFGCLDPRAQDTVKKSDQSSEVKGILLVLENNMPLGGNSVIHPHGNPENFRSSVKKGFRLFPFNGKWVQESTHSYILIECKDVSGSNYDIRLPGFMDVTPDALILELRKAGFSVKILNQGQALSVLASVERSRLIGPSGVTPSMR